MPGPSRCSCSPSATGSAAQRGRLRLQPRERLRSQRRQRVVGEGKHRADVDLAEDVAVRPLLVLRAVEKLRVPDDRELRSIAAYDPAALTPPLIPHLLSQRLDVPPRRRAIAALAPLRR